MDLIEGGGKGVEAYLPDFRYYKIAENEFPKKILLKLNNLMAALFYIETSSAEEIRQAIEEIIEILINEQDKMAVSRFLTWFKNLAERKRLKDNEGKDYHIYNPWEVKNMLTATLDKIRLQGREEGREEGRKELVEVIKLYLISRFNQAPAELVRKMKKIKDLEELKRLASEIYKCRNLEEIKSLW